MYQVTQVLHLTADGQVVDENDPRGVSLLAVPGQQLPDELALKYGLVSQKGKNHESAPETKDLKGAPADKMKKTRATK